MGRGAFGKVHRGVLKELPNVEVFYKPKEERVDVQEENVVAVKVLLGKWMHQVRDKRLNFIIRDVIAEALPSAR